MIRRTAIVLGAALALAATQAAAPARADAVADFYKGKTVTVIVSFDSAGAYGLYTQLLTRHLSKFVPGNPTFVPNYMPGAGGIKATNYLYNVAAKDGSAIGIPPDTLVLSNVLTPDKVKFKATAFTNGSKTFLSCQNGGQQSRRDFPRLVRMAEEGKFDARSLTSNVYKFDDILKSYQEVADRTVIGNVITFS